LNLSQAIALTAITIAEQSIIHFSPPPPPHSLTHSLTLTK
jgi:hypothetical protein